MNENEVVASNNDTESSFRQELTNPQEPLALFKRPKTIEEQSTDQEPPKPEKSKLNRRRFLQITALAMVGAATAYQMYGKTKPSNSETAYQESNFSQETKEELLFFLEQNRLDPAIIPEFLTANNQPDSSYGLFASSSVTIATEFEEANNMMYGLGSGSIVEIDDDLYLSTALHVVDGPILDKNIKMSLAIPGLEPLRCNSIDLYSYGRIPPVSEKPDLPVFIKFDTKTAESIRNLQQQNKLTPLTPYALINSKTDQPISDQIALFRFQASKVGIAYAKPGPLKRIKDSPYPLAYAESNGAAICGGVSGSPLLRVENGQVLPEIAGVVQYGNIDENHPEQPDPAGILGGCSDLASFTPFAELALSNKLDRN